MKLLKRLIGTGLALCMSFSGVMVFDVATTYASTSETSFTSCYGWYETLCAEWSDDDAINATVEYKKSTDTSYTTLPAEDKPLIRQKDSSTGRVDIPGLVAGNYDIKITTSGGGTVARKNITVNAYDRSGYAHFNYNEGVGAYNNDGTLKSNAIVIYVTDSTKDTVSFTYGNYSITGIGKILNTAGALDNGVSDVNLFKTMASASTKVPVVVRFIGKVNAPTGLTAYNSTSYGGSSGDNGNMAIIKNGYNITLEGIGTDAEIYGWGFSFTRDTENNDYYGRGFEVRNLKFNYYPEDALGFEGGNYDTKPIRRIWVHNNSFYKGHSDSYTDKDKADGDGSCDFKRGEYYTLSDNYFEDCHKTNLVGAGSDNIQYNVTFSRNWWNNCKSRAPLARQANIHIFNNYFQGGDYTDYYISSRAKAYIFTEYNYFDGSGVKSGKTVVDCTTEGGYAGIVKSYNDYFTGNGTYSAATIVADKSSVVESDNTNKGFEYTSSLSYIPGNNYGLITDTDTVKTNCISNSGVMNKTSGIEGTGENEQSEENELNSYTLTADDFTTGNITEDTPKKEIFVLKATSDKGWTVDSSSLSDNTSITGNKISNILKSGGQGNSSGRSIYITVAKPSTITVQGKSANSTDTRTLQLYDSNYTAITGKALTTLAVDSVSFFVPAGNYYLGSTNSGFNIYAIVVQEVEFAQGNTATNPTPSIVGDGTNRYALVVVDGATAQTAESVTLQGIANDIASSTGVVINGATYLITDLGGNSGDVVLGYDITDAVSGYTSADTIQTAIGTATVNALQ